MTRIEFDEVLERTYKMLLALRGEFREHARADQSEAAIREKMCDVLDIAARQTHSMREAAKKLLPSPINAKY